MSGFVSTWQNLDMRKRIILLGAIALTFVAVLSLTQIATRPGMALLYSGLDSSAAGEVVGALEQMNIKSEVRGDAIYVPEDERDRVRLALARDNLPRQGQTGYELLDDISGFSATSDMFNAAYWRAKEGELARTILASRDIRAARVHIAVPNRRPFARSDAQATASVTVTMAGGTLSQDQATAIRYLTALAVPELDPDQVAVIDSRAGMVLAPGMDSPLGNAAAQASEREAKLKAEIEQLLAARVGRDRARVSVAVETDRAAETLVERVIQPDTRVTIHSETEEISDSAEGASGNVTVASNLPTGDADANNTRQSARTESRERVNYDYSEVRRETVRQAGAIRRISVAVLVDGIIVPNAEGEGEWQPRPQDELDSLRDLVVAAIGFDEQRGDIVTVESMAFQPDATPGELVEVSPIVRFIERNALTFIQLGFLGVVAMVLAATVIKPLLSSRAAPAAFPEPDALDLPPLGNAFEDGGGDGAPEPLSVGDGNTAMLPEIEVDMTLPPGEIIKTVIAERPDQSLKMLKQWLDDSPEEDAKAEMA